jgi:very-short-patch-repair endonuclease
MIKQIFFEEICKQCYIYYEYNSNSIFPELCKTCTEGKLEDLNCNGNFRYLCKYINCRSCYYKSFEINTKMKYWSDNNILKPRSVFNKSRKKCYFYCEICYHEIYISLYNVSRGEWCCYCASKKLCDNEECKKCFEKSFASHEKSKYIIDKNINPRCIFGGSSVYYDFYCNVCKHEIQLSLERITSSGEWCCYCASKKLCDKEDCEKCFEKSFASHEKSKLWNYEKNELTPRQVFIRSCIKYYLYSPTCDHTIYIAPDTIFDRNIGCGICKNKTESKIYNFLSFQKFKIEREVNFEWCKIKKCLPFDFVINNIIIELDGIQHFKDVNYWNSSRDKVSDNDIYKMKCAILNNYKIIRISQEDVWHERFDWKEQLLKGLSEENVEDVLYISNDINIYNNHKEKMKE